MHHRRYPRAQNSYPAAATGANLAELGSGQPWRKDLPPCVPNYRSARQARRTQYATINNITAVAPEYSFLPPQFTNSSMIYPAIHGADSSTLSNLITSYPAIGNDDSPTNTSVNQYPAIKSSGSPMSSSSFNQIQTTLFTPVRTPIRPPYQNISNTWGFPFQNPMQFYGQDNAFVPCGNNTGYRGKGFTNQEDVKEVIQKLDALTALVAQIQISQNQNQLGTPRIGNKRLCVSSQQTDDTLRPVEQSLSPNAEENLLTKIAAIQGNMETMLHRLQNWQSDNEKIKNVIDELSRKVDRLEKEREEEEDRLYLEQIEAERREARAPEADDDTVEIPLDYDDSEWEDNITE